MMNSWCKFGECRTNRYCNMELTMSCNMELTMSSLPWSLKREMLVKDTNHPVVSVYHVKMNSWCKFGECITPRYCKIDLTISFEPDGRTDRRTDHYSAPALCGALINSNYHFLAQSIVKGIFTECIAVPMSVNWDVLWTFMMTCCRFIPLDFSAQTIRDH